MVASGNISPVVSVIVPVYKVERYLVRCVDSIMRQTLSDLEIILVDDGSPDRCPQICDELASRDGRIKVIHKENEGLGLARNSGLEIAKGRWVLFVDSDDMIALNALEYLVGLGEAVTGVDQVRFLNSCVSYDDLSESQPVEITGSTTLVSDRIGKLVPILEAMSQLPDGVKSRTVSLASAWSAIYRRDIIEKYGITFPSEREYISEDFIFNLDYTAVSGSIIFTPEKFYIYRISPKSLTRTFKSDRMEKSAFLCRCIEDRLKSMGIPYASDIAMGAMIVYMRAHFQHIFDSQLPIAEKRMHFRRVRDNEMIRRISQEYRFPREGLKQRIAFALRRSYLAELMFIRVIDLVKKLLGH